MLGAARIGVGPAHGRGAARTCDAETREHVTARVTLRTNAPQYEARALACAVQCRAAMVHCTDNAKTVEIEPYVHGDAAGYLVRVNGEPTEWVRTLIEACELALLLEGA